MPDERATETTTMVGGKMPDGTVYAGRSPNTKQRMYAMPADAPLPYTFNQAEEYAEKLNLNESAPEKRTWRVPTKGELNVLFQNREAIGGFNETGSDPAGWYWSSSRSYHGYVWGQRFSDGNQYYYFKGRVSSVRCVRG